MKTIHLNIDWHNEDSIEQAERAKERLENKGYHQINSFGGMRHSIIVMGKSK